MCRHVGESAYEVMIRGKLVVDGSREVHMTSGGLFECMFHTCEHASGPGHCWGDAPQHPQDLDHGFALCVTDRDRSRIPSYA